MTGRNFMGVLTRSICVLAFAAALPAPASGHSLEELEDQLTASERYIQVVNRPAPDFALRDADGHATSLRDLRGKVVILYFIYASCPDVCPLLSERIADIQQQINTTPMRDIVAFVAITTDPERDTPDVLRGYGSAHGLDPANWRFLTSGADHPAATRELAKAYGLEFTPTGDGTQMHGLVTHVIDKSGNLRARFHGLKFKNLNLILYVNALTNDTH
ncbi:MAG: SCO family protein [Rhodospirillales bacterium]|nr:SCO family protein [Rhodospirillales bacterium]